MTNSSLCEEKVVKLHVTEAGTGQAFLVASPAICCDASSAAEDAYRKIAGVLNEQGMQIVHERIFGSLNAEPEIMAARERELQAKDISPLTPLTYIQGNPPRGGGLAGVLIRAVRSDQIRTITNGGLPCGRSWQRNGAEFLILQNVQGLGTEAGSNAFPGEARRMIERAQRILAREGVAYSDIVRTWFYLNDMLGWYKEFNQVRNQKYQEFGIMPEPMRSRLLLPASTGIEGITPQKAACAMDLFALTGAADRRPEVRQLSNPRQQDAFQYGSAFSRGAVIEETDVTILEISGTAAIDQKGISLFPDDIRGQVDATLDKIEALISPEGANLNDICAATVFLKHAEHYDIYRETLARRGLQDFPAVCVVANVCREELLFEIDAEAAFHTQ